MIKNKIGFLHIPRTGGTYLEALFSSMGPQKFINFFGTPESQIQNKLGVVERIEIDINRQECLKNIPNWNTAELFSGHFSLNIKKFLPEEYSYDFITVLRNPTHRTFSFIKKITTSGAFKKTLTHNSQFTIGSEQFWQRFMDYYRENQTIGLSNHERNGFSNYITKVFAGCDLSKMIDVDDSIYEISRENLSKAKYIGSFENYKQTIDDLLTMFNISNCRYNIRESQNNTIDQNIKNFLASINKYDIKLYEEFK